MTKLVELTIDEVALVNGGFGGELAAGVVIGALAMLAIQCVPLTLGTGVVAGSLSAAIVGSTAIFLLSAKSVNEIDINSIITAAPFIAAASMIGGTIGVASDFLL